MFYFQFGRGAKQGANCKQMTNAQEFHVQFRTDVYRKHYQQVSQEKQKEIQACSREAEAKLFDGTVKDASKQFAHFQSKVFPRLAFNRNIIYVIIADPFFYTNNESIQSMREKALVVFELFRNGAIVCDSCDSAAREKDITSEVYRVKINSVSSFKMVLEFIAKGASFCLASRFVGVARTIYKASFLAGYSEVLCVAYNLIILIIYMIGNSKHCDQYLPYRRRSIENKPPICCFHPILLLKERLIPLLA